MTRFDEVTRLKELEKKADCPPWKYQKGKPGWTNDTVEDSKKGIMWWGNIADDDAIHLAVDLRNAAPWLLEAAACFQPEDARALEFFIENLPVVRKNDENSWMSYADYNELDNVIRRLQKAAEILEGQE